jgi:hypothetical protein
MRRSRILTKTLVIFVMTLVFFSLSNSNTVKADDPCVTCLMWVQAHFEACEAVHGPSQFCYDQFNSDIVYCYATVCEQ